MPARARSGSRARSRSPRSCRASRRWRTSRSPCRRARARASASSAAPTPSAALNEPAMAALAEVGLAEPRRRAGRRTCRTARSARSSSPSRSRMEPKLLLLDEPMAGAGREETERLVAVLRAPQGPLPDGAGRARHDGGVRARRPHLGADLRPHPRQRHARRSARRSRRASPPIWATRWSERCWWWRSWPQPTAPPQVLFDVTLRDRRRRGGDAARPQRHGQDHDHPHPDGPAARRAAAPRRFDGRALIGLAAVHASRRPGSAWCRRAGRSSRR